MLLPRSAAPPVFAGYADWERFVERLVELGLADEITRVWWDVRPHPRFGTLEIRIADQPTRLETTGALAALLQAMVSGLEADGPSDRGLFAQNRDLPPPKHPLGGGGGGALESVCRRLVELT